MGSGVSGAIMPFHNRPGPQLLSGGCHGNCGIGLPAALASCDLTLLILFFGDSVGGLVGHFAASHEDRREGGIFAKSCQPDPSLANGSTPCGVNQTNGDMFARGDISGKVPGDGREILCGIGS